MSFWISFWNDFAVSLFGSVLSASFCNVLGNRRKRRIFWCCMVLIPLLQGWVYFLWDAAFLRQIYPLIVHLPLILVLYFLTGKLLWPAVSVLTAYLCCQLRRWIALLAVAVLSGGDAMQDFIELVITLPMLLLLLRFAAPAVRQLSGKPARNQLQFGVIPAVYYGFDYLAFLLYHSDKERTHIRLQQVQKSLDLQLTQAVREINALRESQMLACQYCHDLRHHLQYLSACIENGQEEQAQTYISGICKEIEAQKVQRYCENEAANLILSNALENALHACQPFAAAGTVCTIDVQFFEREGKLFLQVTNPCGEGICFEKGIPVSDRPDHGIGVQSICAIV